ncbi:sortase [Naumannella sp. ID2617S]|uniref:Sortase family protein n=1 Tax=Enemella dayhoffiae TaxID=2016507 RepID=A0A255GZF6_9ACTN|nr:class F sortase [Enemella dayhoffiae]NNG20431.1 sortase [Naumannella sp. ID2617S]OYO21010.1 hypothetical protein CGZ93_12480 [Enemella dayhoffiae]
MRTRVFTIVVAVAVAGCLLGVVIWGRSRPPARPTAEAVPGTEPTPGVTHDHPLVTPPATPTATGAPDPAEQPPEPGTPAPTPGRTWTAPGPTQPPTATTAPSRAPAPGGSPTRQPGTGPAELQVPSLGIRAPIRAAAITDGVFQVPKDPATVGVHRGSAGSLPDRLRPGPGTILMSGHVTSGSVRGSLWPLHRLAPGAMLVTSDGAGGTARWRATRLHTVRADQLPADLLDSTGRSRLVVVTCSGEVMVEGGRRGYRDNLIVEAVPDA